MKNLGSSLTEQIKKSPLPIHAIAKKSGVTRVAIHGWLSGKAIPSSKNLDAVIDGLGLDGETRKKLLTLADRVRAKNPRNRKRKTSEEEGTWAVQLAKQVDGRKVKIEVSESPFWDLLLHSNAPSKAKPVPVLIRLVVESFEKLFTYACEAKRLNRSSWIAVVVEKVEPHRYEELFACHKIKIMTEEGLGEEFGIQLKSKLGI
ncbi:MAG: helix-turn-helix transcriptional regulator [Opitutae bacterium]|jgi:transcriptional regulator with XRE-family HTH domain|nr:helix-turn-helix transcriptional regulator [Opitutae bacterium]